MSISAIVRLLASQSAKTVMFLAAFACLSAALRTGWFLSTGLPFFNLFGLKAIPALMMFFSYVFSYLVNDFYLHLAQALTDNDSDAIVLQMRKIYNHFIGRLPGFLLAFTAAYTAAVAPEHLALLCSAWFLSMLLHLLLSSAHLATLSLAAVAIGDAACFQLFFYSFVPGYAEMKDTLLQRLTSHLAGLACSLYSKYIH